MTIILESGGTDQFFAIDTEDHPVVTSCDLGVKNGNAIILLDIMGGLHDRKLAVQMVD